MTIVNYYDTLRSYIGMKAQGKLSNKLLVVLQGSEQQDVRRLYGYGAEASAYGYDILLIQKFAFDNPEKYWAANCMERRVADACSVLTDVAEHVYHGSLQRILLFGGSEGGGIAPVIAQSLPMVSHMILLGSSCMPQYKEFEILMSKGFKRTVDFFRSSGIMNLEELRQKCNEIRNSADSLRGWMGYSYKYWKQALDDTTAYSALSKLNIPILVIFGADDEASPVEGMKQLQDSLGKKPNFTFEIIPEADHHFVNRQGQYLLPLLYRQTILPWCRKTGAD